MKMSGFRGHGSPGGYGGPRPGDFGGCTYRPMGQMPTPSPNPEHTGGGCCVIAALVLVLAIIAYLIFI